MQKVIKKSVQEKLSVSLLLLLSVIVYISKANSVYLDFKDSVSVSDTIFTVGDIATVAGEDENVVNVIRRRKIGISAPPGYSRFIAQEKVVCYNLQSTFKSCQFICIGSKRILVKTSYEEYAVKMFSDTLYSYVNNKVKWKENSWTIAIRNEEESFKCRKAAMVIHFEGLDDGYPKGNTVLKMVITQGKEEIKIPVYCTFSVRIPVIVTVKNITRQEMFSENNCLIKVMDITKFGPVPFQNISQMKDKRASRSIKSGTILHERLVKTIPVVGKDDEVSITVKRGRIQLSVPGIARESGGVGDRIWVKNKKSKKLIRVQIEKKGYVTIVQGGSSL